MLDYVLVPLLPLLQKQADVVIHVKYEILLVSAENGSHEIGYQYSANDTIGIILLLVVLQLLFQIRQL